MTDQEAHYLFSYGTLRQHEVQLAVFGRVLASIPDALPGFTLATVKITDPAVLAMSGSADHPILRGTPDKENMVEGVALAITAADIPAADAYEVDDYKRIAVTLRSGRLAFAYVAHDDAH